MTSFPLFISCCWVLFCAHSFSSCLSSSDCSHLFSSLLSSSLLFSPLLSSSPLVSPLLTALLFSALVNSSPLVSLSPFSILLSSSHPSACLHSSSLLFFGTSQLFSPSLSSSHLLSALPFSSLPASSPPSGYPQVCSAHLSSSQTVSAKQKIAAAHKHTSTVAQPLQCDLQALIAKRHGTTCTAGKKSNSTHPHQCNFQAENCKKHSTMHVRRCNQEQHQCSHTDAICKRQVANLDRATCAAGTLSNIEAVTPMQFASSKLRTTKELRTHLPQQGTAMQPPQCDLKTLTYKTPKTCAQSRHTLTLQNKNKNYPGKKPQTARGWKDHV